MKLPKQFAAKVIALFKFGVSAVASKALNNMSLENTTSDCLTLDHLTLDCLTIDPLDSHQVSVIWLHGLGANAYDFYSLVPLLTNPNKSKIRWIFPNAPNQKVTLNNGMLMPSWFDIYELQQQFKCNLRDLRSSTQAILKLAQKEQQGGVKKIIFAGFSQGGTVALAAALQATFPNQLLVLSSTTPIDCITEFNSNCQSITIHHGQFDKVIPISLAKETCQNLQQLGYQPTFNHYPMAHEVGPQQIVDISAFFAKQTL